MGYGHPTKGSSSAPDPPKLLEASVRRARRTVRTMRIGDHVIYDGRQYVVRGLDPMGVPERRVDLEDVETGERVRVPVAELVVARD